MEDTDTITILTDSSDVNPFHMAGNNTVTDNNFNLKYTCNCTQNVYTNGTISTVNPAAVEMRLLWGAVGLSFNERSDLLALIMAGFVIWAMGKVVLRGNNLLRWD
ncbi:hypothetical protein FPQ18DRAFT_388817 [Pyronema domesticum]|uniref:Uncharacterized protein n=1 Tax=Pyronema omphalodes (strain CBS 100304) TaxID=1076935 RepID=U4LFM4_PYROM|nr:hypothetical protein FPQ18DRAFT_388817 [Pyronema domesticum]CCX10418.1 Protein of unknown function [Pyronema omphalodes CBS 100304]